MQGYRNRNLESDVAKYLEIFQAVAILGPRQCGKSTLANRLVDQIDGAVYLDLERQADRNKIANLDLFVQANENKLICLDEIQLVPEIFSDLRPIIDRRKRTGQFLILGSASRDLIRQTSETLAGRIGYLELTPFLSDEVDKWRQLWVRGGFPPSYLAQSEEASTLWRENFIRTYLERDIPQFGFSIPALRLGRLWTMCAGLSGETLNSSKLGASLGVSHNTARSYVDLLCETFMLRQLAPFSANLKKRLVKTPKIYLRDTGVLHSLLGIADYDALLGSANAGNSFETFVVNTIINRFPRNHYYFYRTQDGAELDLVIDTGGDLYGVECKLNTAPKPTRGFWNCQTDLSISRSWIISPVDEAYPIANQVSVSPLAAFLSKFSPLSR